MGTLAPSKKKLFLLMAALVPLLLSCHETSGVSSTLTSSSNEGPTGPFYKVSTEYNLEDLGKAASKSYLPSIGSQSVLVIPVTVKGYESNATAKTKSDIEKAFNGEAKETGWNSVNSFYAASSYGKFNLVATVTDWFACGHTAQEILALTTSDNPLKGIETVLDEAVAWYRQSTQSDGAVFDKNHDGFLDAVWLVYSAPDYTNDKTLANATRTFWALSSWRGKKANESLPEPGSFSWGSYDFLYRGYGTTSIDAHTYIHETGHLLGLEDYYDYDRKCSPIGGIDMMDRNIIDHNSYSKFALGWVSPYLVSHAGTVTIRPVETSGDCVLIPTSDGWSGNAFDEYLMLEFYTADSLNKADSLAPYFGVFPQAYTKMGVRIYHVDSRLCLTSGSSKWNYIKKVAKNWLGYSSLAHSNTASRSKNEGFRLIQTLDHSGVNQSLTSAASTNAALWSQGDTFSFSDFSQEFPTPLMNNGAKMPYLLTFSSLNGTNVTISVKKI